MFSFVSTFATWLGTQLTSLFTVGAFSNFFINLGRAFAVKSLILPIQFYVMGLLITTRFAFIYLIIDVLTSIYNSVQSFLTQIETLVTSNTTDSILQVVISVLYSVGIVDAFIDVFSSFSSLFLTVMLLLCFKLAYISVRSISDEFYKIGMLIQQ